MTEAERQFIDGLRNVLSLAKVEWAEKELRAEEAFRYSEMLSDVLDCKKV